MQTARARTRHAARTRTAPAPQHPRRVSGPLRPQPAGPSVRGRTGVFERLRALPEHRIVDRLLRGRLWIWLIGLLLGGIVAMQVSLLKLNAGISRAVTTTATLERQNAQLEGELARLSSSERIRDAATAKGMVDPPAGSVSFLRARPDRDPTAAARRMQPPSDDAAAVMANGGREPGVLAAPPVPVDPAAVPAATGVTDPVATGVTDPAATVPADPAATAPATTAPAPDPATVPAPAADPAAAPPGTGAATVPQG